MTTHEKCDLDTKTRWAGTYEGVQCGVKLGDGQSSTIVKNRQRWVISSVSSGVYSININGNYRGQGIAYIDANGVPTLQIVTIDGQVFTKSAVKIDARHRVLKFLSPTSFVNKNILPPLLETAFAVLRRV